MNALNPYVESLLSQQSSMLSATRFTNTETKSQRGKSLKQKLKGPDHPRSIILPSVASLRTGALSVFILIIPMFISGLIPSLLGCAASITESQTAPFRLYEFPGVSDSRAQNLLPRGGLPGSLRPADLGRRRPQPGAPTPPPRPVSAPARPGSQRAALGRAGPVARRPMFCCGKLGLWATAGGQPGNPSRAWERAGEGRRWPGVWGRESPADIWSREGIGDPI